MRILDRYVALEFVRLFIVFALAAPILFIIGDVAENLDRYMDRGIGLGQVALSYVYQTPLYILYAFPIAALIAAIFTVNSLTRHSELVAAKAGGISFFRLILPLPLLGIVLAGAALALSEVVPHTNRVAAELVGNRAPTRTARSDFVYRSREGHVFSIRRINLEEGKITGLTIEREGNEPEVPSMHLVAAAASYDTEKGWTFEDGYLRYLSGPGTERSFHFQRMHPRWFTETPEELLAQPRDPDEMRYAELGYFIEVLERSGARPLKLKVDQAQKLALPVATLIIILFAAPLATSSQRGGAAYGIGISLGVTMIYLMLFKITGAAGSSGLLSPQLAAWLPNLGFLGAALVLLARVRT